MELVRRAKKSEVREALGVLKPVAIVLIVASGVVNILALTGSIYMLQVYDRVLSSQSIPTLVILSLLAAGLFLFQGLLETLRGQILVRLGTRVERRLTMLAHEAVTRLPLQGAKPGDAMQPVRDVDTIRAFLSSQGPVALLDMPWLPIYLGFVFLLHPMLGWLTVAGAFILIVLTLLTERLVRAPSGELTIAAKLKMDIAVASQRNAEAVRAMGLGPRLAKRFAAINEKHLGENERLNDITGGLSSASRVIRMMLQSALLGLGAYYTIKNEMTAGAIIAVSVASARALAPIEIAIANWRSLVAARAAANRFEKVQASLPALPEPLKLPQPSKSLSVESLTVVVPGTQRAVLAQASFTLSAGQVLAVIGPSAAGKSSLARAVAGIWVPARGSVRLDGATLDRWSVEDLGRSIGYLPQDVQLFDGTIAENIARFEDNPDSARVLAAAEVAGVHQLVLKLPNGYETPIGEGGEALSAGQRQRIALARALYGEPFLVVLDEPNSNLDAEGEEALNAALKSVKQRGGIAVVIAHRPSVLTAADLVAVVGNGQITAFGPKDEVLRKALRQVPSGQVTNIVPAA